MRHGIARAYSVGSYSAAIASLIWLVAFVEDFLEASVDSGPTLPLGHALVINLALLMCFGFQHSVMARGSFKALITEHIPEPLERSTYVLASTLALVALLFAWQPIPVALYDVRETLAGPLLYAVSLLGFGLMLGTTFVVDHADLFGLKQVHRHVKGVPYDPPELVESSIYRFVRHPIYLGWLIFFWATPHMTLGHLLLAVWMTGYVWVAIPLEERDLVATLGGAYRRYRDQVPRLFPSLSKPRETRTQS
jgi:protein-S-isoprenylcysteine O-methyltransferase Ste14